MTTTPEPGQRVWIEAEVVLNSVGDPMFAPIRSNPDLPSAVRIAPANYVWHPADVPPQPPVLAENATVRVASDARLWTIDEADLTPHACLWLTEVPESPLADVPGPDDSTPEPVTSTDAPDLMAALKASLKSAREERERRATATPEPPPSGEGAALIAATEQATGCEQWVAIADLLPWRAKDLPWTWDDEIANTLTRQCLCCGRPGHYQQIVEAHIAEHGVEGLGIVVEDGGYVGDGHHRVVAAIRLGIEKLPVETGADAQARWVRDHGHVDWSQRKFGDR